MYVCDPCIVCGRFLLHNFTATTTTSENILSDGKTHWGTTKKNACVYFIRSKSRADDDDKSVSHSHIKFCTMKSYFGAHVIKFGQFGNRESASKYGKTIRKRNANEASTHTKQKQKRYNNSRSWRNSLVTPRHNNKRTHKIFRTEKKQNREKYDWSCLVRIWISVLRNVR